MSLFSWIIDKVNNQTTTGATGAGDDVGPPAAGDQLELYYSPMCGFCLRVMQVMEHLGVKADTRNVLQDREALQELQQARGRGTVPVLRIRRADGDDQWMPESSDIIRYLQSTYGESN